MAEKPRNIGLSSLMKYRFPVTAIASILHRASGLILFIAIPFLLWAFHASLASSASFAHIQACLSSPFAKIWVTLVIAALVYHLLAGIKHLIMDLGYWEGKTSGRVASYAVILISLIVIVLLGVRLW
jgi:succinate dehydrogenase / fumarate reductase cytochrome b subunit